MSITIGKWRRLQQSASPKGTFSVLAIDHHGKRGNDGTFCLE